METKTNNDACDLEGQLFTRLDEEINTTERKIGDEIKIETDEQYALGKPHRIFNVDRFSREVVASDDVGYLIRHDKFGRIQFVNRSLSKYFLNINPFLGLFQDEYIYGEYPNLLISSADELGLSYGMMPRSPSIYLPQFGSTAGELFNLLIAKIREKSQTTEFKRKLTARNYSCQRNFKSAKKYTTALLERYARLLVLRVDFSYKEELAKNIELKELQRDVGRLLNNRRTNKLFENMVGYIWRLEYTVKKGPHAHVVFFFDGAKAHKDAYIAQEIGKYWETTITKNKGLSHNCNRSHYPRRGVGMLHYLDSEKRAIFDREVIGYLTKKDNHFRARFLESARVFRKGELTKRTKHTGRPRSEYSAIVVPKTSIP